MFVIAHASCIVTLESPKSNSFDLCVRKHMWEAKTKLKTSHRKLKEKFAMELCMQVNAHTSFTGFSRIP